MKKLYRFYTMAFCLLSQAPSFANPGEDTNTLMPTNPELRRKEQQQKVDPKKAKEDNEIFMSFEEWYQNATLPDFSKTSINSDDIQKNIAITVGKENIPIKDRYIDLNQGLYITLANGAASVCSGRDVGTCLTKFKSHLCSSDAVRAQKGMDSCNKWMDHIVTPKLSALSEAAFEKLKEKSAKALEDLENKKQKENSVREYFRDQASQEMDDLFGKDNSTFSFQEAAERANLKAKEKRAEALKDLKSPKQEENSATEKSLDQASQKKDALFGKDNSAERANLRDLSDKYRANTLSLQELERVYSQFLEKKKSELRGIKEDDLLDPSEMNIIPADAINFLLKMPELRKQNERFLEWVKKSNQIVADERAEKARPMPTHGGTSYASSIWNGFKNRFL